MPKRKKTPRDPQTHLHIRISKYWKGAIEAAARERALKLNQNVTATDVVLVALTAETDVIRHYARIKKETKR